MMSGPGSEVFELLKLPNMPVRQPEQMHYGCEAKYLLFSRERTGLMF